MIAVALGAGIAIGFFLTLLLSTFWWPFPTAPRRRPEWGALSSAQTKAFQDWRDKHPAS